MFLISHKKSAKNILSTWIFYLEIKVMWFNLQLY